MVNQPRADGGVRRAQRVMIAISTNELTIVDSKLRSGAGAWRVQLEPYEETLAGMYSEPHHAA